MFPVMGAFFIHQKLTIFVILNSKLYGTRI